MTRVPIVVLVVLLATGLTGCAHTRGYPGPERARSEIAAVRCMRQGIPFSGGIFVVSIEKINGASSLEGWEGPSYEADLLPGTYELDLVADWESGGPLVMLMDALNDNDPRHVELTLEAGHTYFIKYDTEEEYYLIQGVAFFSKSPQLPRRGAARCNFALTDQDREKCKATVETDDLLFE